jgi:hypothetical protein
VAQVVRQLAKIGSHPALERGREVRNCRGAVPVWALPGGRSNDCPKSDGSNGLVP